MVHGIISRSDARLLRKGLRPHHITNEEEQEQVSGDFGPEADAKITRSLKVGETYAVDYSFRADSNTEQLHRYLDKMRDLGLDIGRGDSEFGYRMSEPKADAISRDLIIFRRHSQNE